MTPKKTILTERPVPIRIDPATRANLETIKASGLAKDDSAAFRAGAAALAQGLVQPPVVEELAAALDEILAHWWNDKGGMPKAPTKMSPADAYKSARTALSKVKGDSLAALDDVIEDMGLEWVQDEWQES